MTGLRGALTKCVNNYAKKRNLLKGDALSGEDVREGLAAIVSVKHPDPSFSSQTKDKLVSSEVTKRSSMKNLESFSKKIQLLLNRL